MPRAGRTRRPDTSNFLQRKIDYLYAAAIVSDIASAETIYAKLLGRRPADRPMSNLIQWRGYAIAGIQLFTDRKKSGNSTMTIVIADVAATKRALEETGLQWATCARKILAKLPS